MGAGYTGLSAARALARAGAGVVVLERETIGWGASSRNGGFVLPGFKRDLAAIVAKWGKESARRLFAESLESIAYLEALIAAENISCEFRRAGHVTLAENARELAALARERDVLRSVAGHTTRLLDAADITSEIASPGYVGGLLDEAAGSVHPARLLRGLATAAGQSGARLIERTAVHRIERVGREFVIQTDRGSLRVPHVLVATNGYTGPAFPAFRKRVIPIGSHIIATAPLDPDLAGRLIPRTRVLSDSRHLLHYFRLSADSRLLFGGRAAFRPDRDGADARAAAILRRDMTRIFPATASIPVEHAWSGNVAFTRDQLPHVGSFDGIPERGRLLRTWGRNGHILGQSRRSAPGRRFRLAFPGIAGVSRRPPVPGEPLVSSPGGSLVPDARLDEEPSLMNRTPVEQLLSQLATGDLSRRDFVARAASLGLSWSTIGALLMSCTRKDTRSGSPDSSAAGTGELGPMETELSIYNWSDYIAAETVPNFEKEFGVKVNYGTYESNEELVTKLETGKI